MLTADDKIIAHVNKRVAMLHLNRDYNTYTSPESTSMMDNGRAALPLDSLLVHLQT